MESTSGLQHHNSGSVYTPLFICLAGIAGTSMVIVLYHLVLVNYCMTQQRRALFRSTPVQGGQTHAGKGLEQHVLNAIPIVCYWPENDRLLPGLDQRECVICLGEIEEGDQLRFLPNCGHVFHVSCIDGWFSAHTSCPICRTTIVVTQISPVVCESVGHLAAQETQSLAQFLEQGEEEESVCNDERDHHLVNDSISTQAKAVLRHSASLVLPRETKPRHFMRSLSSDPSFIMIDVQRACDKASCSSSSSSTSSLNGVLTRSRSYGTRSVKQLNHISSKLLTSFPQIRMNRGMANGILPC